MPVMKKPQTTARYSQAVVNQVTNECCEVLEDMLTELGVSFQRSYKRLVGCCPIHEGDNSGAWNMYPEGDEVRGVWVCRTHHCEQKWKKTLVGFVHAMLCKQEGKSLPWTAAVDWMVKYLGYTSFDQIKTPSVEELAKRNQANAVRRLNIRPKQSKTSWTRDDVKRMLEIPPSYYINRGYTREILERYDVGYYVKQERVLVPMYDDDYKFVVGFAGRSIHPLCSSCLLYHDSAKPCPTEIGDKIMASKWKNSKGFDTANFLYNYWFAREHIMRTGLIILVEGPGDVWRLEEAGIHNSVALFGTNISEEQLTIIESSWAMNVAIWLDDDEAGHRAAEQIKKLLGRTHRLYFPTMHGGDVGDLESTQASSDIQPFLDEISHLHNALGIREK